MEKEIKNTYPNPEYVKNAIQNIEQKYQEQLQQNIRYERFVADESKDTWIKLLGPDVLFATHPYATLEIVNSYINNDSTLTKQEQIDLHNSALIHDWGELIIDGKGVGDISYSLKTDAHEQEEYSIFKQIIADLTPEIQKYFIELYANIVHNRESKLGQIFNITERIGYLETAILAYKGLDNQRIKNWRDLTGNVFANQVIPLITYSKTHSAAKLLLDKHTDTISEIMALDWDTPFDTDLPSTVKKFKEAKDAWKIYTKQ